MNDIKNNLDSLRKLIKSKGCQAAYISSYDPYLNEYVPLDDCHRYAVSGFTGSVAELIVPISGKAILFVDGRYVEQAQNQVDSNFIEVSAQSYASELEGAAIDRLKNENVSDLLIEGDRTTLAYYRELQQNFNLLVLNPGELVGTVFQAADYKKAAIVPLGKEWSGRTTIEKLKLLSDESTVVFVNALDSIAWLTNCRAFQMPFQGTFRAKALVTQEKLFVCPEKSLQIPNEEIEGVEWVSSSHHDDFVNYLAGQKIILEGQSVSIDGPSIPASDFLELEKNFSIKEEAGKVLKLQATKTPNEIKAFEESFERSDRAIFKTLNWLYQKAEAKESVSEREFFNQTNEFYRQEKAFDQSFNTIAAFDKNSSIIHYGNPKDDIYWEDQQLALLDSGGLFEFGMATDTTRTIFSGGTPSEKQKEIYTLTLKSLLKIQYIEFDKGTSGKEIDSLAREEIKKMGYDYSHGTGHGVGINVHEGGYKISPDSTTILEAGRVGSIEPGIYIPGFGGVRLENVVTVEEVPGNSDRLRFRSFTHIGFDHRLINFDLLDDSDKERLNRYEAECDLKGRAFKQFWQAEGPAQ